MHVFHHPALRDEHLEVHRNMFATVRKWVEEQPDSRRLNSILSSESVKAGKNHSGEGTTGTKGLHDHNHGSLGGHGKTSGSLWSEIKTRDMNSLSGGDFNPNDSSFTATGASRPYSPAYPPQQNPDYGYGNDRPISASGYSGFAQSSYYQNTPNPSYQQENYGGGYQQQPQPYGGPPPNQYGGPPSNQYGGPPPAQYGPPQNQYGGPPAGNYGPPQGQYSNAPPYPTEQNYGGYSQYQQQGPPQPPYGQPYQNVPYPPQNQPDYQPPYGGGNSGGFPGGGYHGDR